MWRFAAARAQGTSHSKADLPCQDQIACSVVGSKTLVAAIADGAGSAAFAERGAEIAVQTVIQFIAQALGAEPPDYRVLLRAAAIAAREAVLSAAQQCGAAPRDLASTLLIAVLEPGGGGALQIGDGVIVVSEDAGEWCWVFWPQRGEYANTTHFLTDDDAVDRFQIASFPGKATDIALLTDGLEPLALHYASETVYEPFFNGIFQPLLAAHGAEEITGLSASLERFLASERIRSRTDDDVSLILATRR